MHIMHQLQHQKHFTSRSVTFSPSSSTVPAHSMPITNGGFLGDGYIPCRCIIWAKLSPLKEKTTTDFISTNKNKIKKNKQS